LLSFSAIQNNDKVGVILFTDRIELFIPPKKGRRHILKIIRELIDFKPTSRLTNINIPLRFLVNAIKKKSIAFLISDFIDENFEDALKISGKKHDMVGLRIYDERETELPDVGLLKVKDSETGGFIWIDTGSLRVRNNFKDIYAKRQEELNDLLARVGVDYVSIAAHEDYVKPLMRLFKKRAK
jgi:uncharacterized protein (DUF58 family)